MAHGYLEDGYGIDGGVDRDRDEDRERRWRDRDERGWRGSDDWGHRDRAMMFGERDRDLGHGASGDYSSGRRSFSANPDDHYRSWRDRHMSELDRDYADYCREREQQFHSDFDNWRRQKYSNPQPLRTGMTQSGISHDPSGVTQAEQESAPSTASEPDVTEEATLGTNSGVPRGRGRG
jgi:hypothetical protein